jgi:sphingomyelin phosphodiesterase
MRYNALVDRFEFVIRGQFFGHSHVDHVSFYPSFKNSSVLSGFFMIAPSLTTATFKNPNYRIMDIDEDTMQVLDYDQYMYFVCLFQA